MTARINKFIVTHEVDFGKEGLVRFGNAYMIPNHYNHSMSSYIKLFNEAKEAFQNLTEDDVEFRTVTNSRWCKGCPIIRFSCNPDEVNEGWKNVSELPDIGY